MKTLALIALLCLAPISASIAGDQLPMFGVAEETSATTPPSQARALQLLREGRAPVTSPAFPHRRHHHHHDDARDDYGTYLQWLYIQQREAERNKPLKCVNCWFDQP